MDINNAMWFKANRYSVNKTQCEMVLDYLEQFGSITPLEAFYAFNCMRLGARIADLRERGFLITTEIAKGGKQYAIYRLGDCNDLMGD